MISEEQLNQLCLQGESFYVDYKRAQYAFVGGTDDQKAELLKDVLCFANSFRKTPAYILIGVDEEPSGIGTICGVREDEVIDDSKLQEFINSKTNRQIPFSAYPFKTAAGKMLQVIELDVCMAGRPYYLRKKFAWLQHKDVWMRVSSSSHIASPDEIAEMGRVAFEVESNPDIKTSLVSENGDTDCLASVDIISNIEKPVHSSCRGMATLAGGSEYDGYKRLRSFVSKLHFRMESENVSRVNAEDLRYECKLICEDSCVVKSEEPTFRKEQFDLSALAHATAFRKHGDLRPKERDDCATDLYFDVLHDGEFKIEVIVYGKNIPEPIKRTFSYFVSVKKIELSAEGLRCLGLALRRTDDLLEFRKWWIARTKGLDQGADTDSLAMEYAAAKLKEIGWLDDESNSREVNNV
jgi:hypothetical protein